MRRSLYDLIGGRPELRPATSAAEPGRPPLEPGSAVPPGEPASRAAPPLIPDHELVRRIGVGSYGEVWLSRTILGAYRAVKIIHRSSFTDQHPFEREFKGIQRFEPISRSHESQVGILHVGRNEHCFYYVMELADDANAPFDPAAVAPLCHAAGPVSNPETYLPHTLRVELQRSGRLPVNECLRIGLALTTALAHIHKNGLVHRDVKPSNVIFINGVPKLADLGLVTEPDATFSFVGTEGFIPPEGPGTAQGDLFALGKLLYELSTGKDRNDYPDPPTQLGQFADHEQWLELGEIIKRACAPNPRERYTTAEHFQADLLLLKTGASIRQRRLLERRLRIMTRAAIAIVAVMLLGVVPYALALLEARHARQQADRAQLAEGQIREQLWNSYLAQAKALRLSGRTGRRVEALKVIKAAAQIRPSSELRNEAIAAMALLDVQMLKAWPPLTDSSGPVGFDAAFERYVVAPTNGPMSIRRFADGIELMRLPRYTWPIEPYFAIVQFSTDGRWLGVVSGTNMCQFELWDLSGPTRVLSNKGGWCRTVSFSPDSRLLAYSWASDWDGHQYRSCDIRLYDLVGGRPLARLDFGRGLTSGCLRFHPVKHLLATCANETKEVRVWDWASQTVLYRLAHSNAVWEVDWSPEGDLLATACLDNNVYLWDLAQPSAPKRVLLGHEGGVVSVSFSFDGAFLASRGWDGTMRIWDPSTGQQLLRFLTLGYTMGLSHPNYRFSHPIGPNQIAVSELLPSRECRLLRPEPAGPRAKTYDFSPDGKWLLTVHSDGIRIWDLARCKVCAFLAQKDALSAVFGPGPDNCLVAARSGIEQWTLTRDNQGAGIGFGLHKEVSSFSPSELVLNPNGSTLIFPLGDTVHILSLADKQEKILPRSDDVWTPVALSAQGNVAVGWPASTGTGSRSFKIFDSLTTNVVCETLPHHGAGQAAFSPDGRWLLVGDNFEYSLWDTTTWQSRYHLARSKDAIGSLSLVAFSPDNMTMAVRSSHETVELLETTSGTVLARLEAPEAHDIAGLRFSPDGTRLAVLYSAGPIQLWDLRLIRTELAALKLDWNLPPYPDPRF